MANLTENKLNLLLVAADITTINTSIDSITNILPVLGLTDEQRSTYSAIDVNNKIFVEDVITEMGISATGIIPSFLNATFIENDLTLFEQSDAVEARMENLMQQVRDIKRVAGAEAYDMARAVYKIYEVASLAGIPGAKTAYEKLKVRFDGQGNSAGRKPDAPIE